TAAPQAVGPYSQGMIANGFIFTSGQIPLDREGNLIEGDIQAQARQCLENIKAILEAAGAGMEDLVKVTVFVTDMKNFSAINEVYRGYFNGEPPARSFIEVAALPKGANVEIEGIAVAE
ncbi:MAG: RidA family protein, partial [Candidatus Bipolaricaulia bacterium]